MPYFEKFPVVSYPLRGTQVKTTLTDITRRVVLNENLLNSLYHYHYYIVSNGERPEDVAYKLYGNSGYHWIVLIMNKIIDPYFEWPLSYSEFDSVLAGKYPHQSLLMKHNTIVVNYGAGGSCNGTFNTDNVATQATTAATGYPAYHDSVNSKIYLYRVNSTFTLTDTIQQYNNGAYVGISGPFTISAQGGFTINTDPLCTTRISQAETSAIGKAVLYDAEIQKMVVNVESGTFSTSYPIRETGGGDNIDAVLQSTVLNIHGVHHYVNEDGDWVARGYQPAKETCDGIEYDKGTSEILVSTARGVKGPVTNYEYETERNGERAKIKVLKPEFVSKVEDELGGQWK